MKTNEEMLADLLERKKEYDIKRAATRRRISVLSAALALILIISTVTTAALIAVNKSSPAAPSGTESVTDIKTETESSITDGTVTDNSNASISSPNNIAPVYFHYSMVRKSGNPDNDVLYGHEDPRYVGTEHTVYRKVRIFNHEEIKEYEISVSRTENYNEEKAYLIVIPSESIELLTDDFFLMDFTENETNSVRIRFRYKEGYTNGKIEYRLFNEDDGLNVYANLNDYVENLGLDGYYYKIPNFNYQTETYKLLGLSGYFFATVRNFDFQLVMNTDLEWAYKLAAEYFGDVDEEGKPLYESDPYMPEYYDCPYCYNIRYDNERAHEVGEQLRDLYEIEVSQGEDESSPLALFSVQDNSKGGVLHQYNVSFYGIIGWTDSNNVSHQAKNITIAVYDTSNPTVALDSTTTSEYGSYFLHFNIPAIEPLNIIVKAYVQNQNISVMKYSDNNVFEYTLTSFNDIPTNYYGTVSKAFQYEPEIITDSLFNRALSIHQALEMANEYANSLVTEVSISSVNVKYLDYFEIYSDGTYQGSEYNYAYNTITIGHFDAFDWDVVEHEYGHHVENKLWFYGLNGIGNYYHDQYNDLLSSYNKNVAIELAWNEGWADFFAINTQRVMINSNNTSIPNVGDCYYDDMYIPSILYNEILNEYIISLNNYIKIDIENYIDTSDITGYTDVPGFDHTMFKGETNEITVAALLLDLVDGISMTDSDITTLSDSKIWNIIIGDETDTEDGCKTLSDFMNAFHDSTELTANEKFYSMYLLRRYELNPYNISVTNVNTNSPLISWTNVSAQNVNRIRILDSSFNQLNIPQITVTNQSSYVVPWPMWTTYAQGHSSLIIVVEGVSSSTPETDRYYSSYYTVVLNAA